MIILIEYEVLLQLVAMAFLAPIVMFIVVWLVWVPKPAKEYVYAKLLRQIVNIKADDLGILSFLRGKVRGPGNFNAKKEIVEFVPRNPEPWVAKAFSADKIPTVFSYSGKAVCVNPEMLAVLEANKILHSIRQLHKKGKINSSTLEELEKILLSKFISIEEKHGRKKEIKRVPAILLDPRILKTYVSKMISPAQIQYMQKKAYEKGYREGERPLFARAVPILIAMALFMMVLIMLLFGRTG